MKQEIEKQALAWFDQRFRGVELRKIRQKLLEEMGELQAAVLMGDAEDVIEEAADVVIVLIHLLRESYNQSLAEAVTEKMRSIEDR